MECVKTEKTTQEMSLDASLKMDLLQDSDGKNSSVSRTLTCGSYES